MNEIPNIIEPKEKIIYDCRPEYLPYLLSTFFGGLFVAAILGLFLGAWLKSFTIGLVGGIIIYIGVVIYALVAYSRIHYAITNKRLIIQSGIIGRDFKSLDYDQIKNVTVKVGLLGVIFHVGHVMIFTGELEGGGKNSSIRAKHDSLVYLSSPYEVMKKLQTHLSARKEELA